MSVFSGVAGCVSLSVRILDLLLASKNNKHEFRSLASAVQNIKVFLTALPQEGITQQGNEVLRQLHAQLLQVHDLLGKVSAMGPLVSLLKANIVREDFLRTNRDLLDTFGILARGEQLLRGVAVGAALQEQGVALQDQAQRLADITTDLKSCRSEFFTEEQAAHSRLLDVAATGKERVWPEELLQHRLLNELKALPQVSGLDDDGLLSEFRALQMLALYNGPGGADNSSSSEDDTTGTDQKSKQNKCKHMDEDLEDFLLQQVCAALAASVAATSSQPLQAGPQPPAEYLCPISQQVMVNPVLLHETGHSFEAANISRWLDMHSKCPMTGQKLQSKQLSSNWALKNLIADWAAEHGIVLPAAPVYTPALQAAATTSAAAASPSMPHTVLSMPHLEVSNSISRDSPLADQQQQQQLSSDRLDNGGKDPAFQGGGLPASCRADSKKGMLRCTRTRWAAALLVLVVVVGVAVGAGVGVATKQAKVTATAAPGSSPASIANGTTSVGPNPGDTQGPQAPSPTPSPTPSPGPNSPNGSLTPVVAPVPSPNTGTSALATCTNFWNHTGSGPSLCDANGLSREGNTSWFGDRPCGNGTRGSGVCAAGLGCCSRWAECSFEEDSCKQPPLQPAFPAGYAKMPPKEMLAWQSSTFVMDGPPRAWYPTADKVIDGNTDAAYYDGSCSHTLQDVTSPWLAIDLQSTKYIAGMRITNRQDACVDACEGPPSLALAARFRNWEIRVAPSSAAPSSTRMSDPAYFEGLPLCASDPDNTRPGAYVIQVVCSQPVVGRYIIIRLVTPTPNATLHLCAVEPFVKDADDPVSSNNGTITMPGFANKCVESPTFDAALGTQVQIWDCDGLAQQLFEFISSSGSLRLLGTNKCLDVRMGGTSNGTRVHVWDCHSGLAQKWFHDGQRRLHPYIAPTMCLDLHDGATNGNHLQIWECNNLVQQVYSTDIASLTPGFLGNTTVVNRQLRSEFNGKCVDVLQLNFTNGARVGMVICNNGDNQRWRLDARGALRSTFNTNKCLEATNPATNGSPVYMWDCHIYSNQRWFSDALERLRPYHAPEKCLDIVEASSAEEAPLQLWDCLDDSIHQRWYLAN